MQKRYLWVLAGALTIAAGAFSPASAAVPKALDKVADVGSPSPAGSTQYNEETGVWTITGTGADIWGSADEFQFAYTTLPGDGGITARLLTQTGGHDDGWAKTGTMLRESLEPGSLSAYMPYTNGNAFQPSWRVEADATPTDDGLGSKGRRLDGGPIWVRTQRKGQLYQHLLSDDGQTWQIIASKTVPIAANAPVLAGLCATMHGGDVPVVATFDNVSVSADVIAPPPVPARVQAFPGAGAVLLTFGTVPNAAGYTVYRREAGQAATAAVKVNAQPTANTWLIDDNAGAGLANDKALIYTVKGVFRSATGELSEGGSSDAVLVTPQAPVFGRFFRHDIGTLNPGSATIEGTTLTIRASGGDIWDAQDGGTYLMAAVAGDYSASIKITEQVKEENTNNDGFAKVGVMIRDGLGLGDRYAYIFSSAFRDPNVHFEARRASGGGNLDDAAANVGFNPGLNTADMKFPVWFKLTKTGGSVSGFYSFDGSTYEQVGEPVNFGRLPAVTYAGVAATAHNDGGTVTGKLDAAYGIRIE